MPPKQARKSTKDKDAENQLFMFKGKSLKDKTDDRFESIHADCLDGTETGRLQGDKWNKAHQAHAKLRLELVKRGAWSPRHETRMSPALQRRPVSRSEALVVQPQLGGPDRQGSVAAAAAAFFPGDWWRALSSEPLAALVVDAMAGAFCDALLDACIVTLEEEQEQLAISPASGSGSALTPSSSAPNLSTPQSLRQLSMTTPVGGSPWVSPQAMRQMDRTQQADQFGSLSLMARSSSDSWTAGRYHACKPLESYTRRIEHAAAVQRPRRVLHPELPLSTDQRKFVWPMAKTNFPREYDQATRRPVVKKRGVEQEPKKDDEHWLLDIGRDGKTMFPYSLALHKAFLESQPNDVLKEKALKVAPLRMTGAW